MQKRKFINKKNVDDLEEFLKSSVEDLQKTEYTCCRYYLGDEIAIFVGWSNGFGDDLRDDVIQDPKNPNWAICVGIFKDVYYWCDFDWLEMPIIKNNNDCWDTIESISPNENFRNLAIYILKNYVDVVNGLNKGSLIWL